MPHQTIIAAVFAVLLLGTPNIVPALRSSHKGTEMLKYMNTSVDPCKDFYEYACGNWGVEHRASIEKGDELQATVQRQLEQRVNADLQQLLRERRLRDDSKGTIKVKHFYEVCTTAVRGSTQQQNFFLQFAQLHNGLPGVPRTKWQEQSSWIDLVGTLRYMYGMDIMISIDFDSAIEANHRASIYLTEPKETMIPAELCNEPATRDASMHDESYENVKRQVSANMHKWFSMAQSRANVFAAEIVRFEFELCKGMRKEALADNNAGAAERGERRKRTNERPSRARSGLNRLNGGYGRVYLNQLTENFDNVINFKRFVDVSLNTSMNEPVFMYSEPYYQHLKRVIKKSSQPTIINYIMYRALGQFHLPNDVQAKGRYKYCVDLVNRYFPQITGAMYERKYQRSETNANIKFLFSDIKEAFRASLRNEWMHDMDARAADQKLMPITLGFPNYQNLDFYNLVLNPAADFWHQLKAIMEYSAEEYRKNLHNFHNSMNIGNKVEASEVQMRFASSTNEIVTGWGLLQQPYYNNDYGNSLKYSVIGQWIASELITAFDEYGWRNNPRSEARWREYTTEGFQNRSECLRTQYSNYLHNNPEQFNNYTRLREIIADSSGLNIAFNAYVHWLGTVDPLERTILIKETAPGLDITNTQLFFVHFAQSRCSARKGDELPANDFLPMDKHTSERYDVNGPLANNIEFAREFGCPMGTEMNPDDKCIIY